jgi:hypothetical protein
MLKKLAGLGFLALLLCFPLQADHKHRRSRHHGGHYDRSGYVEIHVGTRHGHGSFVRGFRSGGPFYGRYRDNDRHDRRRFKKFKRQHRRYFKKHRHYHYHGRCPY